MKKYIVLLTAFVVVCAIDNAMLIAQSEESMRQCCTLAVVSELCNGPQDSVELTSVKNNNQPSAHAYDTTVQKVTAAGVYQSISLNTNGCLNGWKHLAGSDTFTAMRPGTYFVSYSGNATIVAGANSQQKVSVLALLNDQEIVGSEKHAALTTNNALANVSNAFVVYINVGDSLQFAFTGATANTIKLIPEGFNELKKSFEVVIIKIS